MPSYRQALKSAGIQAIKELKWQEVSEPVGVLVGAVGFPVDAELVRRSRKRPVHIRNMTVAMKHIHSEHVRESRTKPVAKPERTAVIANTTVISIAGEHETGRIFDR